MAEMETSVRKVDTQEYMTMLRGLLEEGSEVSMIVTGNSMLPFLVHGRDSVLLKELTEDPKKGEIVFYRRQSGQYVMHRILTSKNDTYTLIGDGQIKAEPGIRRGQIFATVIKARVRGKWIGPGDFRWEFFEHIWLRCIPVRRMLIGIYRRWRAVRKRKEERMYAGK